MNNNNRQILKGKKKATCLKVLALIVFLVLLAGGVLLYIFIHIMSTIGEEQALVPNPPKPLIQTKKYMPQIIKNIFIGMPVDEFNKVAPEPVNENWTNRADDYFASFYGPHAGFEVPNPNKGDLFSFLFNFIIISEEEKKASLASVEVTGKLQGLNEDEIVNLLKNKIYLTNRMTGNKPHLGLWIEEDVWIQERKGYGTKLAPSIIWKNKDAIIVISFPCMDEQCNFVYWRWAVYDISIFKRRIGNFLDYRRAMDRFYWEKDITKIDRAFSKGLLTKIAGNNKEDRLYYKGDKIKE